MASAEQKRERLGSGRFITYLIQAFLVFSLPRLWRRLQSCIIFLLFARWQKKKKKQKQKKRWLCPLNATDPLILNAVKNCSLSLSPDSLSRVKKWQRCWRLLLKRLIKEVQLEGNLKIFSSQVKLSFEFTNSLLQLTNNHTSTSLLSVACTGLFFSFFFRRVSWMPQW